MNTIYRPPSEANSLILQATYGCSYNECAFCAMYRGVRFRVRPMEELRTEIAAARAAIGPDLRKVFLADGDALIAKPSFLHGVIAELHAAFPSLQRIACYASPQSLAVRTETQMRELREAGLTQYYLGIESGHDTVLAKLTKGVDSAEMVRVALKAHDAGVRLSVMILLGAGGRALSREHALASAAVVNAIQPRFVSTLVMTPVEGTPLGEWDARGAVDHLEPLELARELRDFLGALQLHSSVFRSNHASNYLALGGSLPKDQPMLLAALDSILVNPRRAPFRPDWARGL